MAQDVAVAIDYFQGPLAKKNPQQSRLLGLFGGAKNTNLHLIIGKRWSSKRKHTSPERHYLIRVN